MAGFLAFLPVSPYSFLLVFLGFCSTGPHAVPYGHPTPHPTRPLWITSFLMKTFPLTSIPALLACILTHVHLFIRHIYKAAPQIQLNTNPASSLQNCFSCLPPSLVQVTPPSMPESETWNQPGCLLFSPHMPLLTKCFTFKICPASTHLPTKVQARPRPDTTKTASFLASLLPPTHPSH